MKFSIWISILVSSISLSAVGAPATMLSQITKGEDVEITADVGVKSGATAYGVRSNGLTCAITFEASNQDRVIPSGTILTVLDNPYSWNNRGSEELGVHCVSGCKGISFPLSTVSGFSGMGFFCDAADVEYTSLKGTFSKIHIKLP